MATKIKDIIDYYSEHVVSDEIKERVLQRLSDSKDEKEEDEALRSLWDKADSAYMDEEEISTAYKRLFRKDIDSSKGKTSSLGKEWLLLSFRWLCLSSSARFMFRCVMI